MRSLIYLIFLISSLPPQGLYPRSNLWYIIRGDSLVDNSWAVALDSMENIWWATNETPPDSQYNNIFIYRIDTTGQEHCKSQPYGSPAKDRAFIGVVKDS